jgi:GAF domain-containing protein
MTTSPLASLLTSCQAEAGDTLSWVTHAVADSLSGVDYASISVGVDGGEPTTVGATDPLALKADALQYELGCGPCVEAAAHGSAVQSFDVQRDARWPQYAVRVAELGLRGQTALSVSSGDQRLGALNLYSTSPGLLDSDQIAVANDYAAQAATGMLLSRRMQTLTAAARSHGLVNHAVGLVMERYSLDQERAFQYLVRVSQTGNVKLRHVARQLVEQAG